LRIAKCTAARSRALAVFWLALEPPGRWSLYAVDARADHMIMRAIAIHEHSPQADIEALALIVRATTAALSAAPSDDDDDDDEADALREAPAFEEEARISSDAMPPEQPAVPRAADPHASGPRFSLGYLGAAFSPQTSALHALELRASWLSQAGPYVGVGYTAGPALRASVEDRAADAGLEIARYPLSMHAGLRTAAGPLALAAELGAELELRSHRAQGLAPRYTPAPDHTRVLYNLCPRLEAWLPLTRKLAAYMGASADIVLGNTDYTLSDRDTMQLRALAQPHPIRLTLHVGIGIML
jgi:hypothetical protein